jgi:molybdopterin molybdotransferase
MAGELLRRFGAEPISSMHLPDQREATIDAVKNAAANHDLVITIGGVSAGDRDFFPAAFDACQVKRSLQGAAIQPGRPIVVGHAPDGCVVIGLPGNPVSVLACACLFAWPIVRKMLGIDPTLPWRDLELAEMVKPNPHRRAFRPAILQHNGRAAVPAWAGSGDLAHTAGTHGLVELPVQTEAIEAGRRVPFLPWPLTC